MPGAGEAGTNPSQQRSWHWAAGAATCGRAMNWQVTLFSRNKPMDPAGLMEDAMPRRPHLSRRERLAVAAAALGGALSGVCRAITAWLLNHLQF
jgi:hypothetical protein